MLGVKRFCFIFSLFLVIFLLGACEKIEIDEEPVEVISINHFSLLDKKYRIYGYTTDSAPEILCNLQADKIDYSVFLRKTIDYSNFQGDDVIDGKNNEPVQDNSCATLNYEYSSGNEIEYLDLNITSEKVGSIAICLFINNQKTFTIWIGIFNNSLYSFIESPEQDERLNLKMEEF